MRHFPVFLDLSGQRVVLFGAGEAAMAKLRLLMKTDADLHVFGTDPDPQLRRWADAGRITLHARAPRADDIAGARLFYAATDDDALDAEGAALARSVGVLVNSVDNMHASDFITPAIVDRAPVTVAIGTEGTAPVLARRIKADVEAMLPANTGLLARLAAGFRARAASLAPGAPRRRFWTRYFDDVGPSALQRGGAAAVQTALDDLLAEAAREKAGTGRVALVGAGPGDPDLLTRRAVALLHEADVVIHDRLVSGAVLELARREATIIEAGKTGFGPAWRQDDINAEMLRHARDGHLVVRLKGGDPVVFGRLDEEMDALRLADIPFEVVPGITAASAAAASSGLSLTRRGRNASLTLLTGHDVNGFAEQDWRRLAAPGQGAAIYMGKRAATFLRGRLLMHGAAADTPVTLVENASRPDQRITDTILMDLPNAIGSAKGPVVILFGMARQFDTIQRDDIMEGQM